MTIHHPEILEQIFFRLPARSIGRFRCVSKAWKSLLSKPQFIKTHLNRITQHPIQEQSLILVCDKFFYSAKLENAHQLFDEMITPTMLNFGCFKWLDSFKMAMASCDGLIVFEDLDNKFLLVNPTTREIKALPEPPCVLDHGYSNARPGIGYDALNDDYKVVTISFHTGCNRCQDFLDYDAIDDMLVNVYSVKNGTWKTVDKSPYNHKAVYPAAGVYCNGHIHWMAKNIPDYSTVIAAFDLKEEKFRQVPHPSSGDGVDFSSAHLFVFEDCLCLSPYPMDHENEYFVMKDYGVNESWTKFTIPDHRRLGIKPLCLLGEEQMLLLMDEFGVREKLVLYNVKESTIKEIKIQLFPEELAIQGTFLESLLSPCYIYGIEAANGG